MPRFTTRHVGAKDLKVLQSLLNLAGQNPEYGWALGDETGGDATGADAVLVDVDDPRGAAAWPEIVESSRPAVALSSNREFPARHVLHKPIRSQQLRRLFAELADSSERAGEGSDGEWSEIVFEQGDDPALPLAEHLRRRSWDQPVLLTGDDETWLVIDPGAGVWYSNGSDREFATLFRKHIRRDDASALTSSELVDHTNGLEQQRLANLKWRAGLALANFSLHPDLAGQVRMMLPHVPLQALSDTAYSRQARALLEEPISASELADRTGAEAGDIASFLNACHVCGFLLLDRRPGNDEI